MPQSAVEREKITIARRSDFDVSFFRGSGAGGQKRNKTSSGVQIIHRESGAIGRSSDSRSQDQNRRAAFERLLRDPRMKFWIAKKLYEVRQLETIDQSVERETSPEFLRVEIKGEDGKWKEAADGYFDTPEARREADPH